MDDTSTRVEVIPAGEGWHVCEPLSDIDGTIDGLDYLPVIAWTITYDTRQGDVVAAWGHPVVADVVLFADQIEGPVLRRPDGRFVIAENCEFQTEAEVIEHLREAQQRQQARVAKQAHGGDSVPAGDLF